MMRAELISFYFTDRSARFTIYASILVLTIAYGIIANVVFGRSEQEVTYEAAGLAAVLLVMMTFGYTWRRAIHRAPRRASARIGIASSVLGLLATISAFLTFVLPFRVAPLVPIPFMIVYAIVGTRQARDSSDLQQLSARVYAVGLLTGVGACARFLLRLNVMETVPPDPSQLVYPFATTMFAGMAALIINVVVSYISSKRSAMTEENMSDIEAMEALSRLIETATTMLSSVEQARESTQDRAKAIEDLKNTIEDSIRALERQRESRSTPNL
jgi:hypothetical protein